MGERKHRWWTVGQNNFIDECFEVEFVVGKVAHIAFARVAQQPVRQALSAPIEGGNRKTAGAQVAHGLEVLLDEFGPPLEHANGALASRRRRPARESKRDPIAGLDGPADDVLGHRVGGNGDEGHACGGSLWEAKLTPYSRAGSWLNSDGWRKGNPSPRVLCLVLCLASQVALSHILCM